MIVVKNLNTSEVYYAKTTNPLDAVKEFCSHKGIDVQKTFHKFIVGDPRRQATVFIRLERNRLAEEVVSNKSIIKYLTEQEARELIDSSPNPSISESVAPEPLFENLTRSVFVHSVPHREGNSQQATFITSDNEIVLRATSRETRASGESQGMFQPYL